MTRREEELTLMGNIFTEIASWAVQVEDEDEVVIVNEELSKLLHHLQARQIVVEADQPEDLLNGG